MPENLRRKHTLIEDNEPNSGIVTRDTEVNRMRKLRCRWQIHRNELRHFVSLGEMCTTMEVKIRTC